jgi:hypothetical protein
MTTPIENLVANVNSQTQRDTLQSISQQTSAVTQLADKTSAIDAIVDNADQTAKENFFDGLQGNGAAETVLASNDDVIDKVSEDVSVIELLDKSESAIRKVLCRREGRDPSNFADLDAVAADQGLMQSITARQESSKILARSQKAMAASAASTTAMSEIGNSSTCRDEVYVSDTANSEIRPLDEATAKLAAGETGGDASNFPDTQTLLTDTQRLQQLVSNNRAMRELARSPPGAQTIAGTQVAMEACMQSDLAYTQIVTDDNADTAFSQSTFYLQELEAHAGISLSSSGGIGDGVVNNDNDMSIIADSETALGRCAESRSVMDEICAVRSAISIVGFNSLVQNVVYNNNAARGALFASPLRENRSQNIDKLSRNNIGPGGVIKLGHGVGRGGYEDSSTKFGANVNQRPATVNRIRRSSNAFNANGGTTQNASFIDI